VVVIDNHLVLLQVSFVTELTAPDYVVDERTDRSNSSASIILLYAARRVRFRLKMYSILTVVNRIMLSLSSTLISIVTCWNSILVLNNI